MDKFLSIKFPWVKDYKNSCRMRCHLHCDSKNTTKNPAGSLTAQAKIGEGVQLSTAGSCAGCSVPALVDGSCVCS